MFLQNVKRNIKERLESHEQFLTNLRSPRGFQWLSAQNNSTPKRKRKKKTIKQTKKQAKTSLDASVLCLKNHQFSSVPINQELTLFQDG